MKISNILVLFALSVIVKGTWWTVAVWGIGIEPIVVSFGAVFAAFHRRKKSTTTTRVSDYDWEGYRNWLKK